ncbi:LuxR family transcriptional regulator [Microlunatus aurantiacus]|uniref:helix-turn-helix transcriptional regulator n=1 Tax=Microlunatus aurantiacus TaxID=446786 RepID=UPI0031CE0E56
MTSGNGSAELLGREEPRRRLAGVVSNARNGIGGSLVLRGDPGVGKTALLEDTLSSSPLETVRLSGFEAEATVAFAGLQRFVTPLAAQLDTLPGQHRQAVLIATGAIDGPPPDRFLVGLGVLGLLAEAGQHRPLLCAVDDAHWLDPESLDVLTFVARRLQAESVALLFASRNDPAMDVRLAGLPALRLGGLAPGPAVALLSRSLDSSIDPVAAARIARAIGGNPLALIDLAHELSVAELTASSLADEPLPVGHRLVEHYVRQVRLLPGSVRTWLLIAAADSTGNLELIGRAARQVGIAASAGDAADQARLVDLGQVIRFRHPLVRAAVYNAASGTERRRAHGALSAAAADLGLSDLEAWHAAKAQVGTNAAVARRLERVADRAGQRGGNTSRANVLAQAAELTPPGPLRNARLLAAAEASLAAGGAQIGLELVNRLDAASLDPVQRCRAALVRASFALFTPDPAELVWGTARLLDAAAAVHDLDPLLEQTTLLRAFEHCLPPERLLRGVTLSRLGERLRDGARVADGSAAVVLRGLAAHILLPYAEAVPIMRRAVEQLLAIEDDRELLRLGAVGVALTTALWDHRGRDACLQRAAEAARAAGSLQLLDTALWTLSLAELTGGTPGRAGAYIDQVRELRQAIGYPAEHVVNAAYLAWIGAARPQVEALAEAMRQAGFGGVHASAVAALALRDLAEGHYRDAYQRLRPLIDDPFLQVTPLEYPDFVEAAVRAGHPDEALPVVGRLMAMADANGWAWTRGVALRSRALVEPEPETLYGEAIETLTGARLTVDLARAELLYGEWLRRRRRRREARAQLSSALGRLEQAGATVFAARARTELEATGLRLSARSPDTSDLTPREATVARLAAQGRTNAEIGSTLFVSANTVDYHLRKVFQKLGISSRRQLADRLGRDD